ncbi:hypothetical protein [uncultured Parabacteroides sp.]|uniref:hypothetical protein n=1 Tax=uncultured Parabacteroides sp. TaxID=512312 RepID=UPI00259B7E05|nr:hypothetical protein [uncultured Parabacteroides sp.]
MKAESIKCLSVKTENEKLVLELVETSFSEIEAELVGKAELSVFADNQDENILVEKHYDYAKADSCKYDYDRKSFTLTLRKLTSVEKELEELKKEVAEIRIVKE